MRKAGAWATKGRRSRDRERQQQQLLQQDPLSASIPPSEPHGVSKHPQQQQQQPTMEDVAAITAKNYRLAKELSELRVRHREECRNVTRLSMDNINLASKCRDTMAQVRELKAELRAFKLRLRQQQQLLQATDAAGNAFAVVPSSSSSSPSSTLVSPVVSPKSTEDTLLLSSRSGSAEEKKSDAVDQVKPVPSRTIKDAMGSIREVPPVGTKPSPRLPSSTPTGRSAELLAEMDRMDRILAEHAQKDLCIKEEPSLEAAATTESLLSSETPNRESRPEEEVVVTSDTRDDQAAVELGTLAESQTAGPAASIPENETLELQGGTDSAMVDAEPASDTTTSPPSTAILAVASRRRKSRRRSPKSKLVSSDDFEEDTEDSFSKDRATHQEALAAADESSLSPAEHQNDEHDETYDETSPLGAELASFEQALTKSSPSVPSWETQFSPMTQFKFYEEEYPQDISSSSVRSMKDLSDHCYSSMLGEVQEEETGFNNGNATDMNCVDAFEASFQIAAAFPESFSPRSQRQPSDFFDGTEQAPKSRRNSLDASVKAGSTGSDSSSPPPPPPLSPSSHRNKKNDMSSFDPFTVSPQPEETIIPQPPHQELEPLVIKWGSRARDRMRVAADSMPASSNRKKLSVREIVDLSSSSNDDLINSSAMESFPQDPGYRNGARRPTPVLSSNVRSSTSLSPSKRSSWEGMRSILPFQKSSPRKMMASPQGDYPSTPKIIRQQEVEGEVVAYATPPSTSATLSLKDSGDSYQSEPQRPQKTGYDAARAKYEKATMPRRSKVEAHALEPDDNTYIESTPATDDWNRSYHKRSTTGDRSGPRLSPVDAQVLATVSVKDRAAAFRGSPPQSVLTNADYIGRTHSFPTTKSGPSFDESEGDIPLNSSLSRSPLPYNYEEVPLADRRHAVETADDDRLPQPRRVLNEFEDIVQPHLACDPFELESQLKRRTNPPSPIALTARSQDDALAFVKFR